MKKILFILMVIGLFVPWVSYAKKETFPLQRADYVRAKDADTVVVLVHTHADHFWNATVRVMGVDTPEFRRRANKGVPACEKVMAAKATAFAVDWLQKASDSGTLQFQWVKHDKWGSRHDGHLYNSTESLKTALLNSGHGRLYDLRSKDPLIRKRYGWCTDPIQ